MTAEPGIPMPPVKRQRYSTKYPLRTMEIGESFLVEVSHPANREKYQCAVLCAAWKENLRSGKKFKTRQVPEGVRVWRIK